jgi:hypothetical protein
MLNVRNRGVCTLRLCLVAVLLVGAAETLHAQDARRSRAPAI